MTVPTLIPVIKIVNIEPILQLLLDSTKVNWDKGGLDEWSIWARRMQVTIKTSVTALRAIADANNPEDQP